MISLRQLRADRPFLVMAAMVAAVARAEAPLLSPGERLYMSGIALGGGGVPAIVQGDLRVSTTEMPCVNCHRRSGWAGAEGSITVAPVSAAALFAPVTRGGREMGTLRTSGPGTRPAYTDATLMRAIRDGVDPAGRVLSPSMPRYALGAADGLALVAHLRSLSADPPPGLTGSEVHLATITTPGVSTADRQAVLGVLRAFVRDKNAGTRQETRRREHGPWDMKQHYGAYRDWTLHEWELTGRPNDWPAQLAALYRREAVFAVVGGIVDEDFTPVHEFAEKFRVPVVLPQTPLPADRAASEGFYTLYFSRGVALEADMLVERLAQAGTAQVWQVSRCEAPGQAAAARVSERIPPSVRSTTRCLDRAAPLTADVWQGVLPEGAVLALWLDAADLAALLPTLPASVGDVYLSSTLLGDDPPPAAALEDRLMLLHPFVPPGDLERHAGRALVWLKARGLAVRPVAINALLGPLLAAEALKHPRALDSREYFIERIEAMAARSPTRSAYPETVFGPQRRFGSIGCYVLRVPASPGAPYRKVGEWFVPRS